MRGEARGVSDESADYALWVKLASDPSESEEARQHYRTQMEAYLHRRMREAFQLAAQQARAAPPSPAPPQRGMNED
jgi:hypothetical protein